MNLYTFHVRHRNGWGTGFGPSPTHCHECRAPLPVTSEGCGTGYGCGKAESIAAHRDAPALKKGETLERSPAICYPCCGKRDEADMRETGRAVLYLNREAIAPAMHAMQSPLWCYYASNWPGTLKIRIGGAVRHSRNNFGAQRTDVWFKWDGADWHGVNVGDGQILRCKRLKART